MSGSSSIPQGLTNFLVEPLGHGMDHLAIWNKETGEDSEGWIGTWNNLYNRTGMECGNETVKATQEIPLTL